MTVAPTPKLSLAQKLAAAVRWAFSPAGRKDAGALIAAVTAVYVALHRAGL